MKARWACSIVRRYPQAWRERYEDEVLALVEGGTVTLRDVADLARGCVIERAKALIEPGDHPMRASLWFGLAAFALSISVGVCFALAGIGTGFVARQVFGTLSSGIAVAGTLAVCAVIVVLAWQPLYDLSQRGVQVGPAGTPYPKSAGFVLLSILFLGLVLEQWGNAAPYMSLPWMGLLAGVMVSEQLTVHIWPGRRMLVAFRQFGEARHLLTWAQMELDRCQTLVAAGTPAPLEAAQAEVDRLHRQRDNAVAQLQAMGYRARFRP